MDQLTQEPQETDTTALEQLMALVDELKIDIPDLEADLKASASAFDDLATAGLTDRHKELEDALANVDMSSGASLSIWTMLLCLDSDSFIRKQEEQAELRESVAKQHLDLLLELVEFFEHHERINDISVNLGLEASEVAPLTGNPFTDLFAILAARKFSENLINNEELDEKHPELERARVGSVFFGCYCAWHISKNHPEEARKLFSETFNVGDSVPELEAQGLAIEILEDSLRIKKPIH
tara:strand:- start:68 stop:784 length:717 start_codon:yes stop_codon:yes gene_type:complete